MNYIIYNDGDIAAIYSSQDAAVEAGYNEWTTLLDSELEGEQRQWRDKELKATDWIVPITDHPERSDYLTYRTNLRDWPSTDSFPNTRPIL